MWVTYQMKRILYMALWAACMLVLPQRQACGQLLSADLPYFCDFETDESVADWKMNVDAATANRWTIGAAGAYESSRSFYISADGGATATYEAANNIVYAYLPVTFEKGRRYDLAFDWKGTGNSFTAGGSLIKAGYLRVFITNRPEGNLKCVNNANVPSWFSSAIDCSGSATPELYGSSEWQHVELQVDLPATGNYKWLVLAWCNTDASQPRNTASVMIDNLQLGLSPDDGKPGNFRVSQEEGKSSILWQGCTADSYELRYRNLLEADTWHTLSSSKALISIEGLPFGVYEIFFRGLSATGNTIWYHIPVFYIYETDCFDVLNMYNVQFETGTWRYDNTPTKEKPSGYSRIDYGYQSSLSRHTTHYVQDEIDPRTRLTRNAAGTGYIEPLRTVPEGSWGSVRLGNWETGSQYERMTFTYNVDSYRHSVLLLRYAMVMDDVAHPAAEQATMTITIRDENGNDVDPQCGNVDFHTPTTQERQDEEYMKLWHKSEQGIWWQDWRAVGMNLDDYVGQTLTITLTTYDCDQSGHYCYAYFTLACIDSEMDGIPWGDETQTTTGFEAPNGFQYEWYNKQDMTTVISRSYKFEVAENDMNDYICKVVYPTNSECNYSMEASAKPHTPKAEIRWEWLPADCKNKIKVYNASHIQQYNRVDDIYEHHYDLRLSHALWTLPDGTTSDSLNYDGWYIPVSNDGDTLVYSLRASTWVKYDEFADSVTLTIIVPPIGQVDTWHPYTICEGDSLWFAGNYYYDSGEYTDLGKAWTGCDSIAHLQLDVNPKLYYSFTDTICDGGVYQFNGLSLTESGRYVHTLPSLLTGCDSIVTLDLFRLPAWRVQMEGDAWCADALEAVIRTEGTEYADLLEVRLDNGFTRQYAARRTGLSLAIPLDELRPGHIEGKVAVLSPWCDERIFPVSFDVNFASTIVAAKWDNVLAILNEQYNGGYRFRSYQWYKNGQPIDGAVLSWYHDTNLDRTATYEVRLVLEDGTPLWICPFGFDERKADGATAAPAARKVLENGTIFIERDGRRYDIFGRLVDTHL